MRARDLPQPVWAHIYEYDPTYRIGEHQKQLAAMERQFAIANYRHQWKDHRVYTWFIYCASVVCIVGEFVLQKIEMVF